MSHLFTTEQAGKTYTKTMAHILCESWKFAYQGIISNSYLSELSPDHWKSFFEDGFSDGSLFGLILYCGKEPCGVSVLRSSQIKGTTPDEAELVSLYLLSAYIGKGAGCYLLEKSEALCLEKGYNGMVLDVLTKNHRAINFYMRRGFSPYRPAIEKKEASVTLNSPCSFAQMRHPGGLAMNRPCSFGNLLRDAEDRVHQVIGDQQYAMLHMRKNIA